jgi:hypothetical protein
MGGGSEDTWSLKLASRQKWEGEVLGGMQEGFAANKLCPSTMQEGAKRQKKKKQNAPGSLSKDWRHIKHTHTHSSNLFSRATAAERGGRGRVSVIWGKTSPPPPAPPPPPPPPTPGTAATTLGDSTYPAPV